MAPGLSRPESVFALPEGGWRSFFDVLGAPWVLRRARGPRRGGSVAALASLAAEATRRLYGRRGFFVGLGAFGTLKGRLGSFVDGLGSHFRQACGEKVKSDSNFWPNVFFCRILIDYLSFADPKNDVFVWEG